MTLESARKEVSALTDMNDLQEIVDLCWARMSHLQSKVAKPNYHYRFEDGDWQYLPKPETPWVDHR